MQADDLIRLGGGPEGLASIDLHLYGRLCARLPAPENELPIPGEVSVLQCRMLTDLLARQWRGTGNVLEIGTLLGSSTQAIGLGMAANPNRSGGYIAADAFGIYWAEGVMEERLKPLLGSQACWSEVVEGLRAGSFMRAFQALHAEGRPYSSFLTVRRCLVPLAPSYSPEGIQSVVAEAAPIGVLFVDSAKAFYAVRALMVEVAEHLRPGALVCWQDQRWFNSYAIPFVNAQCADVLRLLAIGGDMCVYRYMGGLSRNEALRRLPEHPSAVPESDWRSFFLDLASQAYVANDAYGVVSATLQLAFVLKDLGNLDEATKYYYHLRNVPGYRQHEQLMSWAGSELGLAPKGDS